MQEKIEKVCSSNQTAASELRNFNRQITGRPRKEVNQPGLLSTIVRIVEASNAADRRCCEHLRSVKTLDNLQKTGESQIQSQSISDVFEVATTKIRFS